MIAIVEQRDRVRSLIRRESVQAFYLGSPSSVGQKAEHVRDDDGIVEGPMLWIRLTDNHNAGPLFRLEEALHGRKLHRLIGRDLLPFQVPAWEELDGARDETCDHSYSDKQATIVNMLVRQQVVGS